MTRFYCSQILLSNGWAENQLLEVDGLGSITGIRNGSMKEAEHQLQGPVVPGMPNLHSHAFQRGMAGLSESRSGEKDSFWSWRKRMYHFLQVLSPEDVEAIASQLYLEMLKAGYTSVGEFHYLHHAVDGKHYVNPAEMSERILAASETTGIGLTHLPVLYRFGGFGSKEPSSQQGRFIHEPDEFVHLLEKLFPSFEKHPNRRLGMAPHSLRAVSPDLLSKVLPEFQRLCPGAPLHLHISEQTAEVEECLEWSGLRPVQWLFENLEPDSNWCLIHATHLDSQERRTLAESEVTVGLCPTTEANLGDGIFPMQEFMEEGGGFGIGSDSHVSISLCEELRWLEYQQRLLQRQRNLLCGNSGMSTGRYLYEQALAGGSRAIGLGAGKLRAGSRADWLVLDPEHPLLAERSGDALLDSWIFSGNVPPVRDVFVGGRQLIFEGRHPEEKTIEANYRQTLKKILS